ncbi:exoribonuclease II [Alishewanella tabrizica]|uniref:Exoribonuclease II n=1 Tax=Alishewanella tabrizica TaxID=671278 RepID=A0ABQ2WTG1_9ALTE|nr:exoribonuclease II [Alishewanella tabrizica]GGW67345.1 exoribonuclease 2 [Alishewanella tabrizica]
MLQNNPLLAQLKQQLRESLPTKEGVVRATAKSFGFLEISDKESVFIAPPHMKKLVHGDKISALITTVEGKPQAEPQQLIEAALTQFVGRVKRQKNKLQVVPDHPQMREAFKAELADTLTNIVLEEGDWVLASLNQHALRDTQFLVTVTALIAKADDPEAPWWVVLARHKLPKTAPEANENWTLDDTHPRHDLTALPFFTIDSDSTQDMDDAISISQTETGWQLTVAVADPDAYIPADSPLDQLAKTRAFTTYLPGRNIPMLPRQLADELCSLHPEQQRPALCAQFTIGLDGSLQQDVIFQLAWISSKARFSYQLISDYLEQKTAWQPDSAIMSAQLTQLAAMAKARQAWRQQHAVVFQDKPDYRFELDNGNVVAIHAEHRRIANQMVEEAMIAANIACGQFLATHLGCGLFNTHSGFDTTKLNALKELLNKAACPIEPEQLSTLTGYCQLRRWLQQQPTAYLENRIRRFQSYAAMSVTPEAHFGMGLPQYATWTSPIRKYGDLVNQRLIKAVLAQQSPEPLNDALTQHLAEQRKTQRKAERDIADWLYGQFLAKFVGTVHSFTGEIIDINRAGIRVKIMENGAVGFIPMSLISSEAQPVTANWEEGRCYQADNILYELGQTLIVCIQSIDADNQSITLAISSSDITDSAAESEVSSA